MISKEVTVKKTDEPVVIDDGISNRFDRDVISRRAVLKAGAAAGIGLAGLSVAGCTGPSSTVTSSVNTGATTMSNVIYYTMLGHTRTMADAIAGALGTTAVNVKDVTAIPSDGVLFLGSGCYGSKPGEDMAKFIESHDFTGRKVAVFGTSGGGAGKETEAMADALKQKGADVVGSYHTAGSFLLVISAGHPDSKDLDGARAFARKMAGSSN